MDVKKKGINANERTKSIKGKIMGSMSIAIFMLVVVCSFIMIASMKILTNTIILDTLQPMVKQASKTVESNLHLLADRMMSMAADPRLANEGGNKTGVLKDARNQYELYFIGLYGLSGQIQAQDGGAKTSIASEELFSLLKQTDNLVIGDPEVTGDILAIPVGMPVKRGKETVSYLVGYYKYDALNDVLGGMEIGKTGTVVMINQNGKMVGYPDMELVKKGTNILDQKLDKDSQEIYSRMLSGETGSADGKVKGKSSFIAFAPIRGTRWSLAVEIPKSDYMYIANIAILITIGAALLMIVFSVSLVYRQSQVIASALGKVTGRITQLAEGDLHTPLETVNTRDELELLSDSLKSTVESVNSYLKEIEDVLVHISRGDLNVHTTDRYKGDFVVIRDSLSYIVDSLNQTLNGINQASDRLSMMADRLSRQATELQGSSQQQNDTVNLLVEELGGVRSGLTDVSRNTGSTKEKVDEIARRIADGNARMKDLSQAMNDIHKNASEITKISKLIEDIAFQTNILALNAAVEASRAGSAGKGFAVVADEVRRLAGQSAEAAKNTSEMIGRSGAMIQTGVSLTNDLGEALTQISAVSESIEMIAEQLSKTVGEQERSLDEITVHIEDISSATDRNRVSADDTAKVSMEVSSEAAQLREMLRQFRLRDDMKPEEDNK